MAAVLVLIPLARLALDGADPGAAQVAMAADGSLQCSGEGYAAPIAPREADLRLLPAALPAGWRLDEIAARWETSDDPAACKVPALSLVRLDTERVITATVSVYGPFAAVDADSFLGARRTVDVAGRRGLLLDSADSGFQRWVWTADGGTWVMEAQQLTRDEGAFLAAGVTTGQSGADWRPAAGGLDLQVVARRPGPPADYRPAELAWYVGLAGPDGRAAHYMVDHQPEHPTPALEAARIGAVVSADGTEARLDLPATEEGRQINVWRDGLTVSVYEGPLFEYMNGAPAPVPQPVLDAILDSLAPVPADDPRLTGHAFEEDTVAHP